MVVEAKEGIEKEIKIEEGTAVITSSKEYQVKVEEKTVKIAISDRDKKDDYIVVIRKETRPDVWRDNGDKEMVEEYSFLSVVRGDGGTPYQKEKTRVIEMVYPSRKEIFEAA